MFNDKSSFYWCWCFMQKQICDIYWWNCQQICNHEHNLKFCHRQHQWQQWRIRFRKSIRSEKLKIFERNRIRKLFKNLRKRIRQFENFFFSKNFEICHCQIRFFQQNRFHCCKWSSIKLKNSNKHSKQICWNNIINWYRNFNSILR